MTHVDNLRIHFDPNQRFLLNILLGFLLFGVALDIQKSDFEVLLKHPKAVLVGLLSQWFLVPTLTIALVYLFQPPTSVAMGMILVAACPGGNVSNYATHVAKGNTALAVTTTSVSTLASILTMPMIFWAGASLIPNLNNLQQNIYINPLDIIQIVATLMLIPLTIGMFMNYHFPLFVSKIKKSVKIVSLLIFIGFIVGALIGNWENIKNYLKFVFVLTVIFNLLALILGYFVAKLTKLSEADARAITFETGIHNTTLGLILVFQFFDGLGGMALIVAWYGIWDLITAYLLAHFWSKRGHTSG
jgi:BASS family bile acid:Na+ symporter